MMYLLPEDKREEFTQSSQFVLVDLEDDEGEDFLAEASNASELQRQPTKRNSTKQDNNNSVN